MPVVPFSSKPQGQAPEPLPAQAEPWVLMAAAQMDAQGRLVAKEAPAEEDTQSNG